MAYEPVLTTYDTGVPMPGISVIFPTLNAAARTVNVWRTAGGRQMPVRGGAGLAVSGAVGLVDFEAPSGIPSTYFAEQFDVAGNTLPNTGPATATLLADKTWVHNPFNPSGGVAARVALATGATVQAQVDAAVYYPTGRRAGVAITGQRRGISKVPLTVLSDLLEDADALDAMLGTINGDLGLPPIICVRFAAKLAARIRLPQPLFLVVPDAIQTPINLAGGGTRIGWDLSGAEIDPPSPALVQAFLSRADLDAFYPSRAAMDAAYSSRLAADTDYNLAGYAASTPTTPGGGSGGITGGGTTAADDVTVLNATDNGDGTADLSI